MAKGWLMPRHGLGGFVGEQKKAEELTLFLLLCLLIICGCATPYEPEGLLGGYRDSSIGSDQFHITVQGNGYTNTGMVEQHFNRRAADIVKENGYSGYKVVTFKTSMEPWGLMCCFPVATGVIQGLKGADKGITSMPSNTTVGTGFSVTPDGKILTAYHVVDGAKSLRVYLSGRTVVAAILDRSDPANDLAILNIMQSTPEYLSLAPPRSAKVGGRVFTVGFPVPGLLGQEPKYTEGTISALSGPGGSASLLQISIPIQPGNSGGPVVDEKGNVLGIVTSTAAIKSFLSAAGTLPQNINWAVKSDYAQLLVDLPEALDKIEVDQQALVQKAMRAVCLIEANY
jgi:S1-C subfamily serine protease